MNPVRERRGSILLKAAGEIRSITLKSMTPPSPVGLLFEQYVGSDLWTNGHLSREIVQSRDYLDTTITICAWLNEKRSKEINEREFWVCSNMYEPNSIRMN